MYRNPLKIDRKAVRPVRLLCHPELRNGVVAGGFRGGEGTSQEKKSSLVIRQFALPGNQMFALLGS